MLLQVLGPVLQRAHVLAAQDPLAVPAAAVRHCAVQALRLLYVLCMAASSIGAARHARTPCLPPLAAGMQLSLAQKSPMSKLQL